MVLAAKLGFEPKHVSRPERFGASFHGKTSGTEMADHVTPHIANDMGADKIFVGVKELQCMGARAPYDHPHVYLDMGQDTQILCPYCSTLYVYDNRLQQNETDPKGALVLAADVAG